jgi:hypothetical protein
MWLVISSRIFRYSSKELKQEVRSLSKLKMVSPISHPITIFLLQLSAFAQDLDMDRLL